MLRRITITFTLLGAALSVMVASILLARAWALFVLPWVAIGLALVSLVWSLLRPRLDDLPESALPLVKRIVRITRIAAALILILTLMYGFSLARRMAASALVAGDLRGLYLGLQVYHEDHGDYPPSLMTLLEDGIITSLNLVSPYDPVDINYQRVLKEGYTSHAYQPGTGEWRADGDILLIFERLPWSYSRATWYCPPGYWALFADGTTRWLTVNDMAAAQRTDARRRREINWPVTPLTGTYDPPSTGTHRVSDTGETP